MNFFEVKSLETTGRERGHSFRTIQISPIYQYIQHFDKQSAPFGAGYESRTRLFSLPARRTIERDTRFELASPPWKGGILPLY